MYDSIKNFLNINLYNNSTYSRFNSYFFEVNSFVDNLVFDYTLPNKNKYDAINNYSTISPKNDFFKIHKGLDDDMIFNFYFSKFPEMQVSFLSKIFIPKPFNASPSNIYNGLPWFLDYVHLSFWFFFLSIIVSVLFLIYFFTFVWNNQEGKYPIRETRGFSRAQTGDTMTAIIPMTWSITMLLHASTHSSNFDENTTGTQFCLTVIAYQWGWNYYYPKDIVSIFNTTPIKVGHDNVDYYSNFNGNYNNLLDFSRNYMLNKNFLMGVGSSKIGKNNIQTLQSLFFKPFDSNQNLELPVSLFLNLNSKKNNFKLDMLSQKIKKILQSMDDSLINYTYSNNDIIYINYTNTNSQNNNNFNFFSLISQNKFNFLNFYKNLNISFFFKSLEYRLLFNNFSSFNNLLNNQSSNNIFSRQFFNNNLLKINSIDSHRNKNTFFSNSNKLYSIYKYLTSDFFTEDDKSFNDIQNKINFFNENRDMYSRVAAHFKNDCFYSFSLEEFNVFTLNFLDSMNITINQWLLFNNYNLYLDNQNTWLDFLNFKFLNFSNNFFFSNTSKFLNFNDNVNNLFFLFDNFYNIYNFKKFAQSLTYLSSDNSSLFFSNSVLTFEDFGFVNSSTIKEFWYKNTAYSNFFYFNVLNYFKFLNNYNYLKINNYNFYAVNPINNYKFWEIDSNILLFQNFVFQQNAFLNNDVELLNLTNMYSWPIFSNDLNKSFKNIFFNYVSLFNLLNYSNYSLRLNYLFIKLNKIKNFNFFNFNFCIKNNFNINSNFLISNINEQKVIILKNNYFFFNNFYCDFLKLCKLNINFNNFNFDLLNFSINLIPSKFSYFSLLNFNNKFYNLLNSFKKFNFNFLVKSNINNNFLILDFSINKLFFFKSVKSSLNTLYFFNSNFYWDIFFKNTNNQAPVYTDKPVRVSYRYNDPINFNFKLSSDLNNILYSNKYLLQWQLRWSNQIKNFNSPLFKLYRGNLEKKVVTGFLDFKNINSSFFDENMVDDYGSALLKNFCESKRDKNYWAKVKAKFNLNSNTLPIIDFEKFYFFKNFLLYLPNVNDDLDVNYVLKYLTFDINTSRRNDHLSKFKVFWGPLFTKYIKKVVSVNTENKNLVNNLNIKNINFFKNYSINLLNFDSFYLYNVSNQKNSFVSSLKVISKYSSLRVNFLKNNFFWNFNVMSFNPMSEICFLNTMVCSNFLFNVNYWFFSENNLNYYFFNNSNFINLWASFWFFKDNQQNFCNKLFFNKNFKDNFDMLNKSSVVFSFKSKEIKNITNDEVHSIDLNSLVNSDLLNILNLYQNNFDIKNNFSISPFNNLNLFSNLNYFKYNSLESNPLSIQKFIKSYYYNFFLLQLQKQTKSRFSYVEINNNIPSIRRLRVSKGICLPSDFNIHVICGSKDVIHSWAIPGLGIKIDAIPGFNSHRRVLFRWRGIYWGQCMEVCGRYHHWMPILIRIIHKDLFLVWCLSYLRLLNNKNFKYEKYFFDEILLLNWLSDSSNSSELHKFFNTILDKNNVELQLVLAETSFLFE